MAYSYKISIKWRNLESAPQEYFNSTHRSDIVALLD